MRYGRPGGQGDYFIQTGLRQGDLAGSLVTKSNKLQALPAAVRTGKVTVEGIGPLIDGTYVNSVLNLAKWPIGVDARQ